MRPPENAAIRLRNGQNLPDMAASTLLRLLKPHLLSLPEYFGGITQIFPHRDIDMGACLNEPFEGGVAES